MRVAKLPGVLQRYCLIKHKHLILRQELQPFIIILHRIEIFSRLQPRQSPDLIGVHNKRIAVDSHRAIRLRATIVFKIEFGKSSKKIRIGKIRLNLYHLVEVLY